METKKLVWLGMIVGGGIGNYLPLLWGGGSFSFASIIWGTIGGLVGIWAGFRVSQML